MTKKEREARVEERKKNSWAKYQKLEKMDELCLQYHKGNADIKNKGHFNYNYALCEEFIEFNNMKRAEIIYDEKCDCLCVKTIKKIYVPGSECYSGAMDEIADGSLPNYYYM